MKKITVLSQNSARRSIRRFSGKKVNRRLHYYTIVRMCMGYLLICSNSLLMSQYLSKSLIVMSNNLTIREIILTVRILFIFLGDVKSSEVVIKEIGQALQTVGFFYITGFSEDKDDPNKLFDVGKQIFDLPSDDKKAISIKNSNVFRGYVQKGKLDVLVLTELSDVREDI